MAEIQIGAFDDVPNQSPLTSGWAKDITRSVVHTFNNKAALDAASNGTDWPGLANGARAWTVADGKEWVRMDGVWYTPNQTLYYYRHTQGGPLPGAVGGPGTTWPASPPIYIVGNRRLRFAAKVSIGGNPGAVQITLVLDGVNQGSNPSLVADLTNVQGYTGSLAGECYLTVPAGNHTFSMRVGNTESTVHASELDASWYAIADAGSSL
jgi:hypothetical protein